MPKRVKLDRKEAKKVFFHNFDELVHKYNRFFIVNADNITSRQFMNIRATLRGKALVCMGKNTMMRKVIQNLLEKKHNHPIRCVLPCLAGNVGFVFAEEGSDFSEIQRIINENKAPTAARLGQIAPCDVFVEPGPTGCDPGQTSWFQALSIATKINKGQIEISSRVHLIEEGAKVSESQAALLKKLNINPFSYILKIEHVYDNGSLYESSILNFTNDKIASLFHEGLSKVAATSLQLGYPTQASFPHSIKNALASLISVCLDIDYSFKEADPYKKQ